MKRRSFLSAIGGVGVFSVTDTANGRSVFPPLRILPSTIETTTTNCRVCFEKTYESTTPELDAQQSGSVINLNGEIMTPKPCYEAKIQSYTVGKQGFVFITADETDQPCENCLGEVSFTAELDIDNTDIQSLAVEIKGEEPKTYDFDIPIKNHSTDPFFSLDISQITHFCGQDSHISPTRSGMDSVSALGTIVAPDSCAKPIIEETYSDGDTSVVQVGYENTPTHPKHGCMQDCKSKLSFRLAARVSKDVDSVRIEVLGEEPTEQTVALHDDMI